MVLLSHTSGILLLTLRRPLHLTIQLVSSALSQALCAPYALSLLRSVSTLA